MKIDITSLCFGFKIEKDNDSGTAAWATSIGQAPKGICYIDTKREGLDEIIYGMMYKSHSDFENLKVRDVEGLEKREEPRGDRERMLFSVFENVYVNNIKVNGIYTLSYEREDTPSHKNRLHICYAKYLTYKGHSNKMTLMKMAKALGCSEDACWFVSDISIRNQKDLYFTAIVVNPDQSMTYVDSKSRKKEWESLLPEKPEIGFDDTGLPRQQIFYGAPGTGKSHRIKEIIRENGIDEKEQVIRTTFHPDSDYSTFVGCYKPIMKSVPQTYVVEGNEKPVMADKDNQATKEEIVYDYTPQAFVQAYTKAWTTNEPVILVIEEINRGNCAQIFGDIFQLLDRGYDGVSEYEIKPDKALENYLREYFATFEDVDEQIKTGKIMKLPSNLYIWATMNTSDQSLFPIDSAFKRRWEWKYIKIAWPYKKNEDGSFKTDENGKKIHFNYSIEGGHDWWEFLQQINAIIDKMTNSADKQLGYFFAKAKDDIISYDTFVSKVCFYLWNDIFKTYALDGQESDLFKFTKKIKDKDENEKEVIGHLSFPEFYDGDGNVVPDVARQFIEHVMAWNTEGKKENS